MVEWLEIHRTVSTCVDISGVCHLIHLKRLLSVVTMYSRHSRGVIATISWYSLDLFTSMDSKYIYISNCYLNRACCFLQTFPETGIFLCTLIPLSFSHPNSIGILKAL